MHRHERDGFDPASVGDRMGPMMWHMVGTAAAWFGLAGLLVLLTGPVGHQEHAALAPNSTERHGPDMGL
ncbi:MAG: hypothetical protein JWO26_1582 [Rhodospirillales bacterium]|nr:hypothetical protein [Rhodospirillales bacterium]